MAAQMNTSWRKDTSRIVSPPLACPILFLTAQTLPAAVPQNLLRACAALFPSALAPTLPSVLRVMQEAMRCSVIPRSKSPSAGSRMRHAHRDIADRLRLAVAEVQATASGACLRRIGAQQRPVPDVATAERASKMDAIDCGVGAIACLRKITAQRTHAQHAATSGDDVAVAVEFGAGLEDFHAGAEVRIQPRNHVAFLRRAGIAFRGDHDAERRSRIPFRFGA